MLGYVAVEDIDSAGSSSVGISASITRELIESWCLTELRWVLYEPHSAPPLWDEITRRLRGYLLALWASGVLQGDRPRDAFCVRCDQTTMTPEDIRNRDLICLVGIAPVTPAEFIALRIRIRLTPR